MLLIFERTKQKNQSRKLNNQLLQLGKFHICSSLLKIIIFIRPKLGEATKKIEIEKPVSQIKTIEQDNPSEPETQSFSKPVIGGNASKPFGSKISSKPNFLSKAKEETNNAKNSLSRDYEL